MVAAGLALSRALHVSLAGLGLAAILKTHPLLFDLVRWIGAAYLCWIACKILRANDTGTSHEAAPDGAGWQALQRGFLTNMLNPKALMFCALLLPQFISPLGHLFEQYLALGTILVLLGIIFDVFYVFAAAGIATRFSGSRTGRKLAQFTFASIFTVVAVRLALNSR